MSAHGFPRPGESAASVGERAERLTEHARELLHEVRPRLRGWFHAAVAPVTLVAGLVVVAQAPSTSTRIALAGFIASAVVLFTVSGAYHRRSWSPRVKDRLRRLDHANIFLHIAATYTAFAVLLLEPARAATLLTIVWLATAFGVVFRVWWVDAPRWLHTPAYVVVASVAVLFSADFARHAGSPALTLMVAGAALYGLGALVYGVQRPNPFPRWFGFHEIFHAFTVVAFAAHFAGVAVAARSIA
ncbi:MAG TPA: hemolysin III family protein [Nocardioidaceae bacterium]